MDDLPEQPRASLEARNLTPIWALPVGESSPCDAPVASPTACGGCQPRGCPGSILIPLLNAVEFAFNTVAVLKPETFILEGENSPENAGSSISPFTAMVGQ